MVWDEDWPHSDRPEASELPEYPFFPDRRSKIIFGFYATWFVVTGILLQFVGTTGTVILDIPVLIWITLVVNISSILVLYFVVHTPEQRRAKREGGDE
jgi:hypothetical protein